MSQRQAKRARDIDGGYTDPAKETAEHLANIAGLQAHAGAQGEYIQRMQAQVRFMECLSLLATHDAKIKHIYYEAHKKMPRIIALAGQPQTGPRDWRAVRSVTDGMYHNLSVDDKMIYFRVMSS